MRRPLRLLSAALLSLPIVIPARSASADGPIEKPSNGSKQSILKELFDQEIGQDQPQPFVPTKPRSLADGKRLEALQLFTSARAMEENRRFREAVELLEKAQLADPDSLPILRRLSQLLLILRKDDQAIAFSRKVLQADPGDTATLEQLVRFYVTRKNTPLEAESLLKEILANPKLEGKPGAVLLANHELGKLYAGALNRPEDAAVCFAKVVTALDDKTANKVSPADLKRILGAGEANTYLLYAQVFLAAKKPDLAIVALQRGLVYDPDHPILPLVLAETLLETDQARLALPLIEGFMKRQPQGREVYDLLITTLKTLNRDAEIVPRLKRAAELDSKNLTLQYALAEQYKLSGQAEMASALYRKLMDQQPDIRGFPPLFTTLLKAKKTEELLKLMESAFKQLGRLEAMKEQMDALVADSDYTDQVLDTGLKMLSGDPPLLGQQSWLLLLKIATEAEKLDKLISIQHLFLAKFPSVPAYHEVAMTQARLGKYEEAAGTLDELIQKFPNERTAGILKFLGQLRRATGKLDAAIEAAREARKLDPADSKIVELIALCLTQKGQTDEGLNLLRDTAKLDPTNSDVLILIGELLRQAGKDQEALAQLNSVAERFANNDSVVQRARSTMSIVYTGLGDFAKAEAELEILLARTPDDAGVNNDLGYLYADQGKNLEKAEVMVRKAIDAEPDNFSYLDSLGWVLFKRGKVEESLVPLQRSLKLMDRPDATIQDHLGDVHFALKDFTKARASWEAAHAIAITMTPPDKKAGDIKKKLDSLEKLGVSPKASTGKNP